jgi:hypothetical protein
MGQFTPPEQGNSMTLAACGLPERDMKFQLTGAFRLTNGSLERANRR